MIADCKYCGENFQAKTYRRLFCSDRCKVRYNREHSLTCFYCGDLATQRDHIVPHATTGDKRRKWAGVDYVNCCKDCNGIMGDVSPYSLPNKVRVLIERFTKKYKLNNPRVQWDGDELEEVSDMMALNIRGYMRQWNNRQARLDHMRLRMYQVASFYDEPVPEDQEDDEDE